MSLVVGQKIACKHGMHSSSEYNAWCNMKSRCHNPEHPRYKDWGAKGIKVCDRWFNSFVNFYNDVGPKPSTSHSLERMDGSRGYEPDNCKWATKKEQSINRPDWVNVVTFNGRSQTITDWALELGISRRTLYERLEKWSIERALTTRKTK